MSASVQRALLFSPCRKVGGKKRGEKYEHECQQIHGEKKGKTKKKRITSKKQRQRDYHLYIRGRTLEKALVFLSSFLFYVYAAA